MTKDNNIPNNTVIEEESHRKYANNAFKWIINEKMNILRSRLLNLADSITSDIEQRKSVKGLIKDFCGHAYYPMLEEMERYLEYFKVIEKGNAEMAPRLREEENNRLVD